MKRAQRFGLGNGWLDSGVRSACERDYRKCAVNQSLASISDTLISCANTHRFRNGVAMGVAGVGCFSGKGRFRNTDIRPLPANPAFRPTFASNILARTDSVSAFRPDSTEIMAAPVACVVLVSPRMPRSPRPPRALPTAAATAPTKTPPSCRSSVVADDDRSYHAANTSPQKKRSASAPGTAGLFRSELDTTDQSTCQDL